ncbi:hypothetical protein APICC_05887 [Apis cerana cerana]|uniref:Uncharacterized protein n=1 Tax=Apis cerana cerana TaxID=94128 RepID=A0A2A3EI91_APICC|nr:hypothetical protein APICC_05887 [Apis cerana cerana]
MWLLLSMVSFLICAIVASTNNDDSTVADVIGLGNENNDITTEIHTGRLSKDTWKTWKKESFKERRSGKEIDPNIFLTENGEIIKMWLDLPTEDKRFKKVSQEKNPWLYYWENKRLNYKPNVSNRRRGVFDRWGGKRGKRCAQLDIDSQTKRTKIMNDVSLNEFKQTANTKKFHWIPFNSWGGKRTEKSNNRESFLIFSRNPNNLRNLDVIEDGFIVERNSGKIDEENLAVQIKNLLSTVYKNSIGKRNPFLYSIPLRLSNRISEGKYTIEDEITKNWPLSTPEKKAEQRKKTKFNPWGGKRNFEI